MNRNNFFFLMAIVVVSGVLTACDGYVHVKKDLALDRALPANCFPDDIKSNYPEYTIKENSANHWMVSKETDVPFCNFRAIADGKTLTLENSSIVSVMSTHAKKAIARTCMNQFVSIIEKVCHLKVSIITDDHSDNEL